jgi:glycogen operon protein
LHKAGIEVILDVVFNHTAEGNIDGPLLSFRGIENRGYYLLDRADQSRYLDFTGCGHTINANHSIVRRMILDCLRYWVSEMHVDGFRFDLASVFSRDEWGEPLKNPPLIWEIESDPFLAGSKIIAEAWDAAGLYQVGSFIGHRWAEWNGPFRDDVRRFVRGDNGTVRNLSARLTGSRDLFPQADREPNRSINFVTAHDGLHQRPGIL